MEQREIKFRCWYGNEMHGNMEALRILYNNSTGSKMSADAIIMQYTGHKDNNGSEIYEGDIIILPRKKEPCLVEWHHETHAFKLVSKADPKTWKSGWITWAYTIGYAYNGEKCEVIGNLYTTPELLEKHVTT